MQSRAVNMSTDTPRTHTGHKKHRAFTLKGSFVAASIAITSLGCASAQSLDQPTVTPLEQRASSYVEFRNDIQLIEATPVDSAYVTRDAHNRLASHDSDMLSSGWVAYAALVAADTPAFASSIEALMATEESKATFLNDLRSNPRSVRALSGAQSAIDAVMMMAAQDASKVNSLGESYIASAYAIQNKGWAKKKISNDGTSRVYTAQDYANSRSRMAPPLLPASVSGGVRTPGLAGTESYWQPAWARNSASPYPSPRATPIMDRVLVLAARYAVGDLNEPVVNAYAKNDKSRRCLATAKLNFDQCIAATRSAYEESFCIGKHGLNEVSGCLGWIASAGAQ